MKSNLYRILLFAMTIVSVMLMAMAIAVWRARPDLTSEMNTSAMTKYTFEQTTGENPQWTVTPRFGDRKSIGSFTSPYEALIKGHEHLKRTLDTEAGPWVTEKTDLETRTAAISTGQEMDAVAISKLSEMLGGRGPEHPEGPAEGYVQQFDRVLLTRSDEMQSLSVESQAIRSETAERRTDVLRIQHELEEARTDLARLKEVRRDLTDRLVRLQLENQELQDRQSMLSGKPSSYDE